MTLNELRYIVAVAQRAELRPRRAAVLREPAGAVGRDPEARGGAGRAALRARQERDHGHAGRRAHRRAGAEGARGGRADQGDRAGGAQPARGHAEARRRSTRSRRTCCPTSSRRCTSCAPQMPLDIEENLTENLEAALKSGRIDAAIIALPFAPPGIVTEFLYEEPFQVVVPRGHKWVDAQIDPAGRARRRAPDPAQRRPLLPRPGARRVPGAEPRRGARDADELAGDGAQHGGVGTRRVGAAARRDDAEVPQPARGAGAVHATGAVAAHRAGVPQELSAARGDGGDPRRGRRVHETAGRKAAEWRRGDPTRTFRLGTLPVHAQCATAREQR